MRRYKITQVVPANRAYKPEVTLHIGPFEVPFRRRFEGKVQQLIAVTDNPKIVEEVRSHSLFTLEEIPDEAPAEVVAPKQATAPTVAPPTQASVYESFRAVFPEPVALAYAAGWKYDDLRNAGDGNRWGPEGGFGARSGLTMVELSLTRPPADWEAKAETCWPWQVAGWVAPSPQWAPQKRDNKVVSDVRPDTEELLPKEAAPEQPKLEGPAPEAEESEVAAETRDEQLFADLGEELVAQLKVAITDFYVKYGKAPTMGKAKFLLDELNKQRKASGEEPFPLPDPAQLERLITLAKP
jgi:hypothetical protein